MKNSDEGIQTWCDSVAELIVDVMIDADLVKLEKFQDAASVISMELFVRLNLGDYPPPRQPTPLKRDA